MSLNDKKKSKGTLFYNLMRKLGFHVTLEIIYESEKHEIKQSDFFLKMKSDDTYLNSYFRSKNELWKENRLIGFKLNENDERIMYLTPKGMAIAEFINKINELLNDD